jgi:enamine deaminase RidA (YjgF/YER057c/UK114 family)
MDRIGTILDLHYLAPEEFGLCQKQFEGRMLGAIAYGMPDAGRVRPNCPFAQIDIPVLDRDAAVELWTSEQPVVREDTPHIASARNEDVLFGCLELDSYGRLDQASCAAYIRIFDFIDAVGYTQLLRVWHYFPGINADAGGLERYRQFNVGRYEAFLAKGRVIEQHAPAACALGSRSGPLVVYFLATRRGGRPIENPRQTSAYRYPAQYGLRCPTFSRAMLAQVGSRRLLFISGTSSIVGHDSLHVEDAPGQAEETAINVRTVLEQARSVGSPAASNGSRLQMKAYVRHARDLAVLRDQMHRTFGAGTEVIYFQADICRAELLMEVEGVFWDEG